uniref:Uncharacterized protein n=1 Tax=Colobus angolensis palliatus TaxID=336983 RepID=A0A2K5K461_COLAP
MGRLWKHPDPRAMLMNRLILMGCVKWRCQPRGSARSCSHLKAENSDFILEYVCQPQRINYLHTQKQWSRIFWQDFQDLCHRGLVSVSSQGCGFGLVHLQSANFIFCFYFYSAVVPSRLTAASISWAHHLLPPPPEWLRL